MTGRRFPDQSAYYPAREVGAASGQRGSPNRSPSRRGWRGQNLVEFALIVPVLALFVFGVLDVARIFHALIAISNAAREGARYGMSYGVIFIDHDNNPNTPKIRALDENVIDAAAVQEAGNLGLKLTAAQVSPACLQNCQSGDRLRVTVTYLYQPFLFIVFPQAGLTLLRDVEMVIP